MIDDDGNNSDGAQAINFCSVVPAWTLLGLAIRFVLMCCLRALHLLVLISVLRSGSKGAESRLAGQRLPAND